MPFNIIWFNNILIGQLTDTAMTHWFLTWFAAEKSASRSCYAVAEGNRQFPVYEQLLLLLMLMCC